jgi:hypothetical protein
MPPREVPFCLPSTAAKVVIMYWFSWRRLCVGRDRGQVSFVYARGVDRLALASATGRSVIRSHQLIGDARQSTQRVSDLIEHHPTDPASWDRGLATRTL